MQVLPVLSFVLSVVLTAALGVRLLQVGRRTRELPELAIGAALLLQGAVAGLGTILLAALADDLGGALLPLAVVKWLGINLGASGVALFCWRVFRPGSRWGAAAFVAVVSMGFAGFLAVAWAEPRELLLPMNAHRAGFWLGLCSRLAIYTWASLEAFGHYLRMRRRIALGLADPLGTQRFFLWGLSAGVVAAVYAMDVYTAAALGPVDPQLGRIAQSLMVVSAAALNWLVFAPPATYRRWLAAR